MTESVFVVHERTHSVVPLSVVYIDTFGIVGYLMPLSGWIADRVGRRRLLVDASGGGVNWQATPSPSWPRP